VISDRIVEMLFCITPIAWRYLVILQLTKESLFRPLAFIFSLNFDRTGHEIFSRVPFGYFIDAVGDDDLEIEFPPFYALQFPYARYNQPRRLSQPRSQLTAVPTLFIRPVYISIGSAHPFDQLLMRKYKTNFWMAVFPANFCPPMPRDLTHLQKGASAGTIFPSLGPLFERVQRILPVVNPFGPAS